MREGKVLLSLPWRILEEYTRKGFNFFIYVCEKDDHFGNMKEKGITFWQSVSELSPQPVGDIIIASLASSRDYSCFFFFFLGGGGVAGGGIIC